MDWTQATPALLEMLIGILLLSGSAALYTHGARTAAKSNLSDNPSGCVGLVLLVIGAIALWFGLQSFHELIELGNG